MTQQSTQNSGSADTDGKTRRHQTGDRLKDPIPSLLRVTEPVFVYHRLSSFHAFDVSLAVGEQGT